MSRKVEATRFRAAAPLFAALGDETRLALLSRLKSGERQSITDLTEGVDMTRQAVTKHLRVLEDAGLVRGTRAGRESLYELKVEPLSEARRALDDISRQWDNTLSRLKSFVESGD